MTPDQARLVQAAQDYDLANRKAPWTRVPDDQVLRLLTGAQRIRMTPAGRPCTVVDQVRWTVEWIREHYGPGSACAREHSSE